MDRICYVFYEVQLVTDMNTLKDDLATGKKLQDPTELQVLWEEVKQGPLIDSYFDDTRVVEWLWIFTHWRHTQIFIFSIT